MSFDTVDANCAFADKFGFPYTLLSDTDRALGMAYGACDAPDSGYARRVSFLIDEKGLIQQVYSPVNPAEHAAAVLKDLDALAGSQSP